MKMNRLQALVRLMSNQITETEKNIGSYKSVLCHLRKNKLNSYGDGVREDVRKRLQVARAKLKCYVTIQKSLKEDIAQAVQIERANKRLANLVKNK